MEELKALKGNEFIDIKLEYLKPTNLPAPRFYDQPKTHKPEVPARSQSSKFRSAFGSAELYADYEEVEEKSE